MRKLNALLVKSAKPGRHADGDGLYLLVASSGARSWVLRVQVAGRRRDIGLGSIVDLTLAQAREKAAALRRVARAGRDPIAERDKAKTAPPTFKLAAQACHDARKSGWTERHSEAFLALLKQHVFPKIGSLRVDSIDEKDIVAVLSPLWHAEPAAARKLRQRIGVVLDFAKGSGWRLYGAPRDGLRPMLSKQPKAGNFESMPYADVPKFMDYLTGRETTIGRLALAFTVLTAARSGETRTALWSHVDIEEATWTRPAGVMKMDEEHVVTLSPAAIAVLNTAAELRTVAADCPIFAGRSGRPFSDVTLSKIVRTYGSSATVHGFRSSFRTWAAEQMPSVPDAVAEAALAHVVPDAVVRAYQRAKFITMRRHLMDAWTDYVGGRSNVLRLVAR